MAELCAELVNIHFDDNRKRKGLTVAADECMEEEGDGSVNTSKKEDKSRKGSVDHRILTLVNLINSKECFFTTSSCSGRAILFTHAEPKETKPESSQVENKKSFKKGCEWIFVSHDEIDEDAFMQSWSTCHPDFNEVCFKVEPSILHIQCRRLSDAKKLVHVATESGFRNSGMVIGKDNKITVAVRMAMSLEVPLVPGCLPESENCENLISEQFLRYLVSKGNEKLIENWMRTDKFTDEFRKTFY